MIHPSVVLQAENGPQFYVTRVALRDSGRGRGRSLDGAMDYLLYVEEMCPILRI